MTKTLEAMPGAALVVLLVLAGVGGWWLCRGWDWFADVILGLGDAASRTGWAFLRALKRLVLGLLVGCGLLFLIGVAYQSTH